MKKYFFLSIITFTFSVHSSFLFAQSTTISKVPHQISIETGYSNLFYVVDKSGSYTNKASNGFGVLFDYGWQLGGLDGKKPAIFLTVPIGFTTLFPDNNSSKRISMMNYGWTVRHELSTNPKIVPFVGYGLFLNRLSMSGTDGEVIGHQTQFEGGVNFNMAKRLKYFAKLQCSYASYPKLGDGKSIHFMFADLRVGIRF